MKKKFKAMVLSCIDPRFQNLTYNYLKIKKQIKKKFPKLKLELNLISLDSKISKF